MCHQMMDQSPTTIPQRNIVILGGSYGGVSTAHYILKHVIPVVHESSSYRVVLVSASSQAMCRPACPRALISDDMFPQGKLFVDINKSFEQYPASTFCFVHGKATTLDHRKREVVVSLGADDIQQFSFHALVIATGASTPSPLLGLNRDEKFLKASWVEFRKALTAAKSIVIAGGGPAGVETAGELGEFLNGRAGWLSSHLPNTNVQITVLNAGPRILSSLRPAFARKAEDYLAKVGVTVMNHARVRSVSPPGAGTEDISSPTTLTLEDGKTLEADLYIPATGTKANTGFFDKDLLTPDGRIKTNPSTLRVDEAGSLIYAIGDVSSYARPAIHVILEAVPVLCANIKHDLLLAAGQDGHIAGKDRVFKEDTRETQLVPIGRSKGVGAAMGYALPSFFVWLIKGRDYWLWTTGNLWSGKQWAKPK